jgi:hypothetical protein
MKNKLQTKIFYLPDEKFENFFIFAGKLSFSNFLDNSNRDSKLNLILKVSLHIFYVAANRRAIYHLKLNRHALTIHDVIANLAQTILAHSARRHHHAQRYEHRRHLALHTLRHLRWNL